MQRNLDEFQNNLMHELDHNFSIIGISETRIIDTGSLDFNPNIPGFNFEYVSTPLSAEGVGMYIDDNLNYKIIEKNSM